MSTSDAPFVVDVSDWPEDDEHPFYPEGSRDKRLLRSPARPAHAALVPHHRYLFKQSRRAYPEQFWAEVVAYRIGLLSGVPVPPAYPACDPHEGVCAALIEWFYGYVDRPLEGFLSGGMFMKAAIGDYDAHRGTQHNFQAVELTCSVYATAANLPEHRLPPDWPQAWAKMLAFDALIGNTDRHHENWGFVFDPAVPQGSYGYRLAPAFDNGTSLGHERPTNQFPRFNDPNYLDHYIGKGYHHMRWEISDPAQAGHFELLARLADRYPATRSTMLSVVAFDPQALRQELLALTQLQLPVPLSPERADFMLTLTMARRERIARTLSP